MKPESCEILFQKFPYTTLIRSVLRFHMTHSPARSFERDSPHQNLKLRLSHRGWRSEERRVGKERSGPCRAYSIESNQKIVKFGFRLVANAGQTQPLLVYICLIELRGSLQGI